MDQDPRRRARARLALYETGRRALYNPALNVNMVDYGLPVRTSDADDRPTIRFHVDKKLSPFELQAAGIEQVPRQIGEFTTDVIEGQYRPHLLLQRALPADPTAQFDPLRGGISISDALHQAAGTLGGLVRDRATGASMLLSNWHVLVVEWSARPGQRICQPGLLDGGTASGVVAALTRDAMVANLDAAVATLSGARQLINDQLGIGPAAGVGQARLGMRVTKSGRTTRVTKGIVTGLDGIAKLAYGTSRLDGRPIYRQIRKVVTIVPSVPGDQASGPGDSGSWWLNDDTREAVALHFAGSDFPERALGIDMQSVLDALNVDLVTDQPPTLLRSTPRRPIGVGLGAPPTSASAGREPAGAAAEELVPR